MSKFKLSDLPHLIKKTAIAWNGDDPWRLSAVVAYYAIIALPALLVIVVNTVGYIWGADIVQGKLTDEFEVAIGKEAAESIKTMMENSMKEDKSFISTVIGLVTVLVGATGVFYHLQLSLNQVWNIKLDPDSGIKKVLIDRVRGFGFVLVIGFLLLISFVLTAGIAVLNDFIKSILPDFIAYVAFALDTLVSVGIVTLLFALIYKFLPDAKIQWRTVWVGALITAVLFALGKFLLSLYFSHSDPASTYGAAGSIVLILLWVSYSCLIFFFGAEFTFVFAEEYGHGISPTSGAVRYEEKQIVTERGSDDPAEQTTNQTESK